MYYSSILVESIVECTQHLPKTYMQQTDLTFYRPMYFLLLFV